MTFTISARGRSLGTPDQFQDLRALALGAGCGGCLSGRVLRRFLASFGVLLRGGGRGFAALGGFLALGRALLLGGTLLRGRLLRRNGRALFRNGGGVFGGIGFYGLVNPFCASRMTIHHSTRLERQGRIWSWLQNQSRANG